MHNMQIDAHGPDDLRCLTTYNKMRSLRARDEGDSLREDDDTLGDGSRVEKGTRNVLKRIGIRRRKK